LRGGVQLFQARRQHADLRIQRGQALGLVGLVAHLGAQGFADGAQGFQKTIGTGGQQAQRGNQRLGQRTRAGRRAARARAPGPRCLLAFEVVAIHIHHDARQVLQRLPQLGRMAGMSAISSTSSSAPMRRPRLAEPLDPGDARQVHAARELGQRGGGQVVGFVQHQQAVVQLGQHARAQRRQQQIVVGHDHLRAHQLLALVVVGALAEGRAVLAGARAPSAATGLHTSGSGGVSRLSRSPSQAPLASVCAMVE
jgi:hypothetical protein